MSLSPGIRAVPSPELGPETETESESLSGHVTAGHLSAAELKLLRLHQQSLRGAPAKDASKPPAPAAAADVVAGLPVKGKPRLLLMGQRR